MPYIYSAELFCDSCGEDICKRIRAEGCAPTDPSDESSYDSDEFPKYAGEHEEADCPNHCGSGEDCLEAIILPSGRKIGQLCHDTLTTEGKKYVLQSHEEDPSEVTSLWLDHFGLEFSPRITDYEIINHGIDHSQYFQGCGVAYTQFDHVATGIGDNPAEAIDDCLELMAQGDECDGIDWEAFEKRMLADEGLTEWPQSPSVSEDEEADDEASEMYYHISIRYNVRR